MKLSDATQALFDKGTIGNRLVNSQHLPIELFPISNTWNQLDNLPDGVDKELRASCFGSPPTATNKTLLNPGTGSSLEKTFVNLNASAVRFLPHHKI
jgi:hypothetical protein